ncbi:thiamine phosphate synthase [Chryseobacterium camelliae]|uniref:thiamine phosphate synthase n=1 Tax=Chryseobacterium camelliae TaxID=1265445 RepID=UPI002854CF58|nr:thiamine phosphate synthase [Chryseobacterium camelliae]MDR6515160.1 thiamine-phosphate pyrophosphorylase [Chryseobacterium camelliae]
MILVITPENPVQNETDVIHQLFREKLDLLHVRKPGMSIEAMREYISRIDPDYHSQLVLHSHYSLAEEFGISRIHFREADRQNVPDHFFDEYILSTSVHIIDCFNELDARWEYAFISPVFPSISKKGYGTDSGILESIQYRKNDRSGLIALGGISQHTIDAVFTEDVDGAALLGAVWESKEPVQMYIECRQAVLSL